MTKLFDCNASFGLLDVPPLRYAATADELLAEMDFCNIDEALVTCAAQRCDSPLVGNELVLEYTRGHPRLHPAWMLLPPQTGEQAPTVDLFLADMAKAGVKALWALPARNRYLLNAATFGSLFEELIQHRVPLFLPLEEAVPGVSGVTAYHLGWQLVDDLLTQFPRLTLVVASPNVWGEDRYFRPLIGPHRHLLLEISSYELGRGLEEFCRHYGPSQLLFGTRYPEVPMGGPVLNLLNADIGREDKKLIGSGNLTRLLQEVRL